MVKMIFVLILLPFVDCCLPTKSPDDMVTPTTTTTTVAPSCDTLCSSPYSCPPNPPALLVCEVESTLLPKPMVVKNGATCSYRVTCPPNNIVGAPTGYMYYEKSTAGVWTADAGALAAGFLELTCTTGTWKDGSGATVVNFGCAQ